MAIDCYEHEAQRRGRELGNQKQGEALVQQPLATCWRAVPCRSITERGGSHEPLRRRRRPFETGGRGGKLLTRGLEAAGTLRFRRGEVGWRIRAACGHQNFLGGGGKKNVQVEDSLFYIHLCVIN